MNILKYIKKKKYSKLSKLQIMKKNKTSRKILNKLSKLQIMKKN